MRRRDGLSWTNLWLTAAYCRLIHIRGLRFLLFDLLYSAPGPPPPGFVGVQGPEGKDGTACCKEVMDLFAGKDSTAASSLFTADGIGNASSGDFTVAVTPPQEFRICELEERLRLLLSMKTIDAQDISSFESRIDELEKRIEF